MKTSINRSFMSDQKREYEHHIAPDVFIEAITATPEEFDEKKEEYKSIGIERIRSEKLDNNFDIDDEDECTVISNANIGREKETITLKDWKEQIMPSIVIVNSKLTDLKISNCILNRSDDCKTNFYFITVESSNFLFDKNTIVGNFQISEKSTIGNFVILRSSTTGNFKIDASTAGGFRIDIGSSTTGDIMIEGGSTIGGFNMEGGLTGDISIEGGSTARIFHLWRSSTTGDVNIERSTVGSFTITRGSTTGDVRIAKESKTGDVMISDYSTTGDFRIINSQTGDFEIEDLSTTGDFKIINSQTGNFLIKGVLLFEGDTLIEDESTTGDFSIINSQTGFIEAESILASFKISNSTVAHMRLNNCSIPIFELKDQSQTEAFIRSCSINLINLTQTIIPNNTTILFSSVKVHACLLDEIILMGNLYFKKIKPIDKPFSLSNNINKARLNSYKKFKESLVQNYQINSSHFSIIYSSLGQTEFIESDLESFETFEFNHSHINQIFISGLKAPTNVQIPDLTEDDEEWYEQIVSFYNQLSQISEQQGFIYNAVKYRSKSAGYQQQRIKKKLLTSNDRKESKNTGNSESEISSKKLLQKIADDRGYVSQKITDLLEYVPFLLNSISNKHGESWGRATAFFIGMTILFYTFYLSSMGYVFSFESNIDWALVGYYFEFINPVRPIDFMNDTRYSITWGTKVIDFFARLVIGYGVYQFLTAFRKYKKK